MAATPPEIEAGAAEVMALTLGLLFYLAIFVMVIAIGLHYLVW